MNEGLRKDLADFLISSPESAYEVLYEYFVERDDERRVWSIEDFEEDLKYCTEYTKEAFENLTLFQKIRLLISRLFVNLT